MRGKTILLVLFALGWLGAMAVGAGQEKAEGERERREEALAISRAAAGEYEVRVGDEAERVLELNREPVFRWSNPEVGDVYGNVFVWTPKQPLADGAARPREEGTVRPQQSAGRPLVVGSLFHWFSSGPVVGGKPSTMEHELISLAEEPIAAKFHGQEVWATREAGVKFADVPKASAPAASEAQRNAQLRQLAKEFTGMGIFRTSPGNLELRLLPQPIYRYSAAEDGVLTGGLFAFVRATDPEILLLIEARGTEGSARWQFAAVRSHSMAELWLEHGGQRVWQAEPLAVQDTFEKHNRPYTAFKFREIPEFLKGTGDR